MPPPPRDALETLAEAVPTMKGAEYASIEVLIALWDENRDRFPAGACRLEIVGAGLPRGPRNAAWNLVGRVHFNLA